MKIVRTLPSGPRLGQLDAIRRRMGGALALLVALVLFTSAPDANAACRRTSGQEVVFTLQVGTLIVEPDLPVGAVIKSQEFGRVTANTPAGNCSNGGYAQFDMLQGVEVPGMTKVFSTNVAGIGIRLSLYLGDSTRVFPDRRNYSGNASVELKASSYYTVELIKTAPVTGSGSLTSGAVARSIFDGDISIGRNYTSVFVPANGITVVTPTCKVDTGSRNIVVKLGQVPRKNFSGVGSTAGERPFNIKLNCNAGVEASNNIYLTMNATPDPSGQDGVMQISQTANAATGVGIQVRNGAQRAVRFGEAALVGPSMDGVYNLPFTARYYQTAPNVTAGTANGMATFDITYK